jgi:hypothetical protein
MFNFRSSTVVFFADDKHRALIGSITGHVGWTDSASGIEGIDRQAKLLNDFIKSDRVSGSIVLFNEETGAVIHAAPFGAAARKSEELRAAASQSDKALSILEKIAARDLEKTAKEKAGDSE